jgi:hypothetical protein
MVENPAWKIDVALSGLDSNGSRRITQGLRPGLGDAAPTGLWLRLRRAAFFACVNLSGGIYDHETR